MIAKIVYVLCAFTSVACAALLVRGYVKSRVKLLLWSSLCFVGLALNNIMLFVDLVLVPGFDLRWVRSGSALTAMGLLTIGLVWESR